MTDVSVVNNNSLSRKLVEIARDMDDLREVPSLFGNGMQPYEGRLFNKFELGAYETACNRLHEQLANERHQTFEYAYHASRQFPRPQFRYN